jgi:hypothetical protein
MFLGGPMNDTRILALCAWTGPALIAIFLVAMVPLAHMVPPLAPTMSGAQLVVFNTASRSASECC